MTLYMFVAGLGILIYTGVASVVAATGGTGEAPGPIASNRSPAMVVAAESTRAQAAGKKLFQELGVLAAIAPRATASARTHGRVRQTGDGSGVWRFDGGRRVRA